ncbi:MAG: hypothetical protein ABIR94_22315, partial [Rubrivivax sp.]
MAPTQLHELHDAAAAARWLRERVRGTLHSDSRAVAPGDGEHRQRVAGMAVEGGGQLAARRLQVGHRSDLGPLVEAEQLDARRFDD